MEQWEDCFRHLVMAVLSSVLDFGANPVAGGSYLVYMVGVRVGVRIMISRRAKTTVAVRVKFRDKARVIVCTRFKTTARYDQLT